MTVTNLHGSEIIGNIRIQPLSETLFRIEEKGPCGFEDQCSFTIVNRPVGNINYKVETGKERTTVRTLHGCVSIPNNAESMDGIHIETVNGTLLKVLNGKIPERAAYPSPSSLPSCWILSDIPRVIPPSYGDTNSPEKMQCEYSGWNFSNMANDVYVFLPEESGYETFRKEFLELTGNVPLPPLYTFGIWYSRYHPYSEETALDVIDTFRKKNIPLDVFVVDTDWRVGASCGYEINTNLFPDMVRFLKRAHEKRVRVIYNDHPEPVGSHAVDPDELKFRRDGLHSLLDMGADAWWFDRNWHTHLHHLTDGINKEVWGMKLYHDITLQKRPGMRPLIMSNVDGINNGHFEYPTHPAAHRYPVWWTGDTLGQWEYLKNGIKNGINSGIQGFLPYVNEDLGGHIGHIDSEFYTRFMQFGAFSPVTRIHCTCNHSRYPWQYGRETEKITGDYFRLRMRLLPMIYAAAAQAWQNGTPLMRRCDLEWPEYQKAASCLQYLFGDDLLVAPVTQKGNSHGLTEQPVWIPGGDWMDIWSGKVYTGPQNIKRKATIEQIPLFVRLSGIIVSAPQSHTTKEFKWDKLTMNVYLPAGNCETHRCLYEDNGIGNEYVNGQYGETVISLDKENRKAELIIKPSEKHTDFQAELRTWTIRIYRPETDIIKQVSVNGNSIASNRITNSQTSGESTTEQLFNSRVAAQTPYTEIKIEQPTDQTYEMVFEW